MPNWCTNSAYFTCPTKEVYDKLLDSIKTNTWFQTFAPLGLDPEQHPDGWDYTKACEMWNTKWSATDVDINDSDEKGFTINVSFESAWSPPTGVYRLMNKNHNIDVTAYYDEPGSCFFGRCMYVNDRARDGDGEKIESDETYDYPDHMNELEELRKTIGIESDLDEYMNSTWINLQEMWEEEEEEEEEEDENKM
jgi:hypothetical protein